jgi:hypothetical protein
MAALPARFRGPRARNAWVGNLNVINSLRNVPAFTGRDDVDRERQRPGADDAREAVPRVDVDPRHVHDR